MTDTYLNPGTRPLPNPKPLPLKPLPHSPAPSESEEAAIQVIRAFQNDPGISDVLKWTSEVMAMLPLKSDDDHAWWDEVAQGAIKISAIALKRRTDAEVKRRDIGDPHRLLVEAINEMFKVITKTLAEISNSASQITIANTKRLERIATAKADAEREAAAREAAEAAERQAEAEKIAREANDPETQHKAQEEVIIAHQDKVEAISKVRGTEVEKPEPVSLKTDDGKIVKMHVNVKINRVEVTDWRELLKYLLADDKNTNVFKLPEILTINQAVAKKLISSGGDIPGLYAETEEVTRTRTTTPRSQKGKK